MKSQKQEVLEYLQSGKGITPIEALNMFGCFRLADVIYKIKKMGYKIETKMVNRENGKPYAKYFML